MMEVSRKRIPTEELDVGMILAEAIIDANGGILIPAKTVITQKHILRINFYQTLSVVILAENLPITDTTDPSQTAPEESDSVIHEDIQAFNDFKNQYIDTELRVREKLNEISAGNTVELDDLIVHVTGLLTGLKIKGNLFRYLNYIRVNDDYTFTHSLNVSMLCNIFAGWLKFSPEKVNELTMAGLLHDVGKVKIDAALLNKPGKLTESEFSLVKKHSKFGYEMMTKQNVSENIKYGILMHHEKLDGSGYPIGLKEAQIHEYAKIIGIADIYDAMTSNRSYHQNFSPFKVIQIFEQDSFGRLDARYLFVFLENIAYSYIGNSVLLNDGTEGKIVFIHTQSPSRPIIQTPNDKMIDLLTTPHLSIEELL